MSVTVRERELPSGTVQIVLDVYLKGKRSFEALGLYLTGDRKKDKEIRALAEATRAKREIELHNEKEGFRSQNKKKVNFFTYARTVVEQKSGLTQRNYINMLEYLKALTGPDLTFEKLTPRICESFKAFLLSGTGKKDLRGLKKRNSAATYYERFRAILRKASDDGIITQNPSKGIFISTEETLPKYLDIEQLNILAKTPCGNEDVRDAFFFACYTGLRYGDASTLTWNQIHGDGIHLVQQKTKGGR